jgi:sec-independent protein translocase protein TatA
LALQRSYLFCCCSSLFGGRKIPELMKGIGQGLKDFKKASKVDDDPGSKEDTK